MSSGDYGGTPGPGVLTAVGFGPAIWEPFMLSRDK